MGVSGIVQTRDGQYVCIKRSNNVSFGKEVLTFAVCAAIKTKYALREGNLHKEGLVNAIMSEILEELNLSDDIEIRTDVSVKFGRPIAIKSDSVEKLVLIDLFLDITEGNKPQLMFYAKLNIDAEDLKKQFFVSYRSFKKKGKGNNELKMKRDGNKMIFLSSTELDQLIVGQSTISANYEGKPEKFEVDSGFWLMLDSYHKWKNFSGDIPLDPK